ncbi:MAG: IS66 family insertion sequence element accessory protein TnpB, partial [bacterium]|nr:IS66 family insertion sequence element accessory protein TnpB [bacterium]
VDMRKSINGLAYLVEQEMALSPFERAVFVFCNRQRDKIKILCWEKNGFILWYKRLEKQRFPWPRRDKSDLLTMTGRELNWLLDGIDLFRIKPHEALSYKSVA